MRWKAVATLGFLAIGLSAMVWVNWPNAAFTFPTLSSADIASLTGTPVDNYRLRVHLASVRYTTTMKPWTDLKEPARSLWAILTFEDVAANGGGLSKYNFQLSQDPSMPTLENITEAYRSFGAARLAAWLVVAARKKDAAHEMVPAALLAEGRAAWVAKTRQHADEIARGLP